MYIGQCLFLFFAFSMLSVLAACTPFPIFSFGFWSQKSYSENGKKIVVHVKNFFNCIEKLYNVCQKNCIVHEKPLSKNQEATSRILSELLPYFLNLTTSLAFSKLSQVWAHFSIQLVTPFLWLLNFWHTLMFLHTSYFFSKLLAQFLIFCQVK